jgi:chemotaxis protein methyltransferase CheR
MPIDAGDFDYIRKLLRDQTGIVLEDGKQYLVETRLVQITLQAGCASLHDLVRQLRARPFDRLHQKVIEALTTGETKFFRDTQFFEALKLVILPELIASRAAERRLNLWCAAASTGQEPYSVAMVLYEHFPELAKWNIQFIASDISDKVLERARHGFYSQLEINRGLPAALRAKYFHERGNQWLIADQLRRRVEFRKINLIAAWPPFPLMDIILMRNILIYFDTDTKKTILTRVRQLLKPDGYLFLGTAETTLNLDDTFKVVHVGKAVCYQLHQQR